MTPGALCGRCGGATKRPVGLLRLPVRGVLAAAPTEFLQFHAAGVVAAVLLRRIIALFAIYARQGNDRADIFLRGHTLQSALRPGEPGRQRISFYAMILVMTPAPTVRPPSRMANLEPCSRATGMINVTSRLTLSPGMTISTPSGSLISPVTSMVRM